jgi:choline dehydrogenase-like flavoprotein
VDRDTRKEVEVRGRAVVLAASCVESARILLNSKSREAPSGLGNGSGQAGRNLCDHLYGTTGFGYLPQLLGQPSFPDNVSNSQVTWMPRWQNLPGGKKEAFRHGYSLYPTGGCAEFPSYHRQLEGSARLEARDEAPFDPVSFYCEFLGARPSTMSRSAPR